MASVSVEDVRKFYDDNVRAFELLGQGGTTFHRAVWGPGVTQRKQAFDYIDACIQREVAARFGTDSAPRVLDLGCGVGASLTRMAQARAIDGVGVTISAGQVKRATALLEEAGLEDRVRVLQHSFTDLPDSLGTFDVAFAIESFVHSPSADAFLSQAARRVRPGGLLLICDDFLTQAGARASAPRDVQLIAEFQKGWHAPAPISNTALVEAAQRAGFSLQREEDFTPYLELRRPRDRMITLLVALFGRLPIRSKTWSSWKGGDALQLALIGGLISYRFFVFERV